MSDPKQLPPKNPMEEFQERIVGDLKEKIGTMLPPEALSELVKRAVQGAILHAAHGQRRVGV